MSRFSYVVWGLTIAAILSLGLFVRTRDAPTGAVLSQQDFEEPAPFPVRKPGVTDPTIRARHAVLLDAESFYPLFKQDAYLPVPIASTTKMMTALLTVEHYPLDTVVTIPRQAVLQIGSDTDLRANEQMTVGNLLKALLIESGNDAAYTLASQSGSVETFVTWMNEKARAYGLRATVFKDPAGLDDEGRSTAFDLAVLAAHFLENDLLRSIVLIPETDIASTDGKLVHHLKNSNRLVTQEMYFTGIMGIKTGFTPAAGHTLVAAAERGGRRLISVILFTLEDTKEASARESAKLLSWGFDNHFWVEP